MSKTIRRAVFSIQTSMQYHAIFILLSTGVLACNSSRFLHNTGTNIVMDNESPRLISRQFSFTEGPASNTNGDVFFTDQPNDRIWKYSVSDSLSLFMEGTGRSNGLYFDKAGNIVACADANNELWLISPDKNVAILVDNYGGKKLNGPNDLWIDKQGGIYFTDPYYQRNYWNRKQPDITEQRVYYVAKGSGEPVVVADNIKKPNGIIGTPDGKYLYVADIGDNKIYRYTIGKNHKLNNPIIFANQGSDGMTIDNKGNVYLTGKGVTVYDAAGNKIKEIPINEPWTANVTFGGKQHNKLFITASKALYVLPMNVTGAR